MAYIFQNQSNIIELSPVFVEKIKRQRYFLFELRNILTKAEIGQREVNSLRDYGTKKRESIIFFEHVKNINNTIDRRCPRHSSEITDYAKQ